MTRREKTLVTALGIIMGAIITLLGGLNYASKVGANALTIKNNAIQISQLQNQIKSLSINPEIRIRDEVELKRLEQKKQELTTKNGSAQSVDIYQFSQQMKNLLQAHSIRVEQFQIDASKHRLNIQGNGKKVDILRFLAALETPETSVQTWNLSLDSADKETGANSYGRFSIGLGHAEAE